MLLHGKQPADLHTGMAQQMATYAGRQSNGFVDAHVEQIKAFYRERRDVMLRAIEEHFPAEAHFTRPAGGLFVWAELPTDIDTRELLVEAVQEKVAFVPGQGFHPDQHRHEHDAAELLERPAGSAARGRPPAGPRRSSKRLAHMRTESAESRRVE